MIKPSSSVLTFISTSAILAFNLEGRKRSAFAGIDCDLLHDKEVARWDKGEYESNPSRAI